MPKMFLGSCIIHKLVKTNNHKKTSLADTRQYYSQTSLYGNLLNTDTSLLPTVFLSLGKESPYISFKFKPLNMEILLRGALSMAPFVSALMAALKLSFHKATTENR